MDRKEIRSTETAKGAFQWSHFFPEMDRFQWGHFSEMDRAAHSQELLQLSK